MVLTSRRLLITLFFVSLFVLSARNVTDPDFGWHLRTGEYIVSTVSIPHFDFLSFTAPGQPWITHEWFAQVVMYVVYRLGGFAALTLLFAMVSAITFGLVYLRCEGKPYVAVFVVLLAAISMLPFQGVRPHVVLLLFTALCLYILDRYQSERRERLLLWLLPLTLIWTNAHGSAPLGAMLIATYLGADWVENAYRRLAVGRPNRPVTPETGNESADALQTAMDSHSNDPRSFDSAGLRPHLPVPPRRQGECEARWNDTPGKGVVRSALDLVDRPLTAILVACVTVIVLNPSGARIYTYPFETLTSPPMQAYIQEWQPPDFGNRALQPFLVFLVLTLLALVIARPRVSLASLVLFAAFTYASLRASRQISIWVLIAAPLLAASVTKLLPAGSGSNAAHLRGSLQALNWLLLLAFLLAGTFRIVTVMQSQAEAEREYFPVKAVDTLLENGWRGPIFNQYNWGGYLIWRLYPRERVFIDGRADVYSLTDDFVVREYLKAYTATADWREPLDRYGVRLVLLEPDAPLVAQLARDSGWRQVYADASAVMYVRE